MRNLVAHVTYRSFAPPASELELCGSRSGFWQNEKLRNRETLNASLFENDLRSRMACPPATTATNSRETEHRPCMWCALLQCCREAVVVRAFLFCQRAEKSNQTFCAPISHRHNYVLLQLCVYTALPAQLVQQFNRQMRLNRVCKREPARLRGVECQFQYWIHLYQVISLALLNRHYRGTTTDIFCVKSHPGQLLFQYSIASTIDCSRCLLIEIVRTIDFGD